MNQDTIKSLLIRDKQFLRSIYDGPNVLKNKRILTSGNDNELNTLLKYLFCVTNGIILINSENFKKISEAKKLKLLQKFFEKKTNFLLLLKGPRQDKIDILLKLSCVLPYLMFGLFNLEKKLTEKQNGI